MNTDKQWLKDYRNQIRVGELTEFRADGRWQRRKIKSVNGDVVEVEGYQLERGMVWPAHGEHEIR